MNSDCGRIYSTMFLFEAMPNNFRIEYTRKLSRQTFFLEKQRLPTLQEIVLLKIKTDQINKLQVKLRSAVTEIQAISQQLAGWIREDTALTEINGKKEHVIPRKCAGPDCSGFLSSKMKCAVCRCYTCSDCAVLKLDGHVCLESDIATQALLKQDTKNCPSCRTPIYKISGCSQMYCVVCRTAFDWKTLKIETGRIHNPHYYEMQRQLAGPGGTIAREPGDELPNDCCFLVQPGQHRNPFISISQKLLEYKTTLKSRHRIPLIRYFDYMQNVFVTQLSHLLDYELEAYRRQIRANDACKQKYASQYLEKKIYASGLFKSIDLDVFFTNYAEIRLNEYLANDPFFDTEGTQQLLDAVKAFISNRPCKISENLATFINNVPELSDSKDCVINSEGNCNLNTDNVSDKTAVNDTGVTTGDKFAVICSDSVSVNDEDLMNGKEKISMPINDTGLTTDGGQDTGTGADNSGKKKRNLNEAFDESRWLADLTALETKNLKYTEFGNILQTFVTGCLDIIHLFFEPDKNFLDMSEKAISDGLKKVTGQVNSLRKVCNIALKKTSSIFSCVRKKLSPLVEFDAIRGNFQWNVGLKFGSTHTKKNPAKK